MAADIRLPSITGRTDREQIEQIRKYLYQLAEQLNYEFDSLEKKIDENKEVAQ